jgi:hypothetical protein
VSLSSITITARHSTGAVETVYSGDPFGAGAFQGSYVSLSTINPVTGGFDWNIQRSGGWFGSGVELTIDATDNDGNHTIEVIVWHLPVPGFAADVVTSGILEVLTTIDPSGSPGVMAPVGTILMRKGSDGLWQKFGLLDTQWRLIGQENAHALGAITITSGNYLLMSNHLILTSRQRVRLMGTGRLGIRT